MRISPERFEQITAEVLDGLPDWVQERLVNVEVIVEGEPPADKGDLLGLYEGIPLTQRALSYFGVLPDRITLFRRRIQATARDEEELRDAIEDTIVHEIAHFFGISDERLDELGRD
jgi:predicted Zn-dependent protease with MMP-like domain